MNKQSNKIVIAVPDIVVGGIGSYITNVSEVLQSHGWTVHLMVTNDRGDLYNVMNKSMICHDLSSIPLSHKKVFEAADLMNKISPDIILLNHASLIHYTLPLLKPAIKPIVVLHSDDQRFYATATMFSSRIFRWIAPTEGVTKKYQAYLPYMLLKRIRTVPHGISTSLFYPNRVGNKNFSGTLCFIGYIAENKGADLLPNIMNKVVEVHNNAHLTIVGYGPLVGSLKKRFEESNIFSDCKFTGPLSSSEVAEILRTVDIFLSPTRIEGFGLSIIEAMMSGAVPVVSRLEGITDFIVDDGVTGILVEPDDVDGFAHAVIKLLNDKVKLQSMSDAARRVAIERYSLDRMLDDYEEIFAEKDDREHLPRRGKIGWYKETISEVMKKGVDGKWLVKRAKEFLNKK